MSTREMQEIQRIRGNITNSLSMVAEKGVAVPADAGSDELPGLISEIAVTYVDDTLAVSGAAADAKVVGERLAEISEEVADQRIPYIVGDSTVAGAWTGVCEGITEYSDGLTVLYRTNIAGVSGGTTLNINGLGAVPVYRNVSTAITTTYPVGSVLLLTYSGGAWLTADYDANSKNTAGTSNKVGAQLYLVGGTSQTSSGTTTYTNKNVYVGTDNCLYSNGEKVATEAQLSEAIADKVSKTGITLDKDTDGLIYIFVDGKAVGNGVEFGEIVEGDVIGTLDENNNILLSGNLADGTYTLKFENHNGEITSVGELIVSSIISYTIIKNLTNCTASGAITINSGSTATVLVVASEGYELPDTIAVDGASYTWNKTTGTIVLSNPAGDVTITVNAVQGLVNLAVPNTTNKTDWNIWCNDSRIGSDGLYRLATGQSTTNYIEVDNDDDIYIKGMSLPNSTNTVGAFAADKSMIGNYRPTALTSNGYATYTETDDLIHIKFEGTNALKNIKYIRISGVLSGTADDVIITRNQPIS